VVQNLIGETLGHYRIIKPIEQGGMASVFLGRDIHLQREVAIKVFQPQKDQERTSEFFRRFTREAQIVARLDHPNILQVYDYGEQDGLAYLVMPYMTNGSLKHLLAARGHLPIPEALHLIFQLLDALQYAHDQGLIHRDIKPGNILFKNSQIPVLADFGLVKEIATGETLDMDDDAPTAGRQPTLSSSFVMGTPYYMAPEQIRGQVQPASDLYSIGLVLYEMLTGQHPYATTTRPETFNIFLQQLYEPPRPIRDLNPNIPPRLAQVIMRALEKDVTRRYQRPADFLLALRAAAQQLNLNTQPRPDDVVSQSTLTLSSDPAMTLPVPTEPQSPPMLPVMEQPSFVPASNPPQHQHISLPGNTASALAASLQYTGSYPTPRKKSPARLLMSIVGVIVLASILFAGVVYFANPGFASTLTSIALHKSNGNGYPTSTVVTPSPTLQPTQTTVTQPMPPTQTSCPPAGQGRAAVLAPYASQGHASVIYTMTGAPVSQGQTSPSFSTLSSNGSGADRTTLMRYDITTGKTNPIFFSSSYITDTQLSADGQWIIFAPRLNQLPGSEALPAIQMVRIDGQGLQTLYCSQPGSSVTSLLASPGITTDEASHWHLVFSERSVNDLGGKAIVSILDMKTGEVTSRQTPARQAPAYDYKPISWINDADVYLLAQDAPDQNLSGAEYSLLDLAVNNQTSPATLAFHNTITRIPTLCSDLDISTDLRTVFTSQCKGIGSANRTCGGCPPTEGPSTVSSIQWNLDKGQWNKSVPIYTNSTMAIIGVRAITSSTLLLLVGNNDHYNNLNGLWKINTDGTGLQRLTTEQADFTMFNSSSQYPWSNASRDGSMYAFKTGSLQALGYDKLFIGPLSGGQPTTIAAAGMGGVDQQAQLEIVGWTTF